MVGMFATSKAGHDKGQMYIIIKEEGDFAYLADGRTRTLENPKKKRKKHLQAVKAGIDEALAKKLKNGQIIYNEEIKSAIKIRTKQQTSEMI
ncbi:hypothetical protein IMSAG249_01729 [Lachnospiraceae bacterium]|nr:hypothetical protein [Lachnospiraceae bacterium]GFI69904.1 hypothetical protein IMSAG249_01729 [Lachnospiraceae bacterium]